MLILNYQKIKNLLLGIEENTIINVETEVRKLRLILKQGTHNALSVLYPTNLNYDNIKWGTEISIKLKKLENKFVQKFEVNDKDKTSSLSDENVYVFRIFEDITTISAEFSDPCSLVLSNSNLSILKPKNLNPHNIKKGTEIRVKAFLEDNKAVDSFTLTTNEATETDSDIVYRYEELEGVYEVFAEKCFTVEGDCNLDIAFHNDKKVLPANYYQFDSFTQTASLIKTTEDESFTKILIPEFVGEISKEAFEYWYKLKSIEITKNVKTIGSSAFENCSSLNSITFSTPSNLESIRDNSFRNCFSLTSITIPESIKEIGNYAFQGCSNLESVTSLSDFIGVHMCLDIFKGTTWLNNQFTNNNGLAICNNSVLDYDKTKKSISIPYGCTTICCNTFHYNYLTSIEIPETVTYIGRSAFSPSKNLTSITIPNSVTKIEESAFSNCEIIETIVMSNAITRIGEDTFYGCKNLISINLPDNLKYIGYRAFKNCNELNSIYIPDNVTTIGDSAFEKCGLTSIEIPESVINMGSDVFLECNNLTKIKCRASSQPETWNQDWNPDGIEVDWFPWE